MDERNAPYNEVEAQAKCRLVLELGFDFNHRKGIDEDLLYETARDIVIEDLGSLESEWSIEDLTMSVSHSKKLI